MASTAMPVGTGRSSTTLNRPTWSTSVFEKGDGHGKVALLDGPQQRRRGKRSEDAPTPDLSPGVGGRNREPGRAARPPIQTPPKPPSGQTEQKAHQGGGTGHRLDRFSGCAARHCARFAPLRQTRCKAPTARPHWQENQTLENKKERLRRVFGVHAISNMKHLDNQAQSALFLRITTVLFYDLPRPCSQVISSPMMPRRKASTQSTKISP